ncbi:MAG: peptidoglycan DD-metalloendopeptidase family protein [Caulobacteraceae bacterium]|nr:peptidoglycan DD-metalloendopeptidase family protein [Caulobacteraceae bacterium]
MRRAVLALLVAALAAAPAWGQREDGYAIELQRRDKARERDALRADAVKAAREVEQLRARLVVLARVQSTDEGTALAQRARLRALSTREQILSARMGAERARQGRLLAALQAYSRHPPPALLVSPRSANDAVRAAILMRAVTPDLQRRAAILQGELDAVAQVRRQAALAGEALFLTESELAERRAETERLIARKIALEQRYGAAADVAAREVEALARRAASLGALVGDLGERPAAPQLVPPRRLGLPVRGSLVRRFGQASGAGRSLGLAFRAGPAAQVLAPAAATVEYAGPLKNWGGVVILRLEGGYRVVLAGLDEVAALSGRRVAAGEPVGRMARGKDHELYMEVRRGASAVDPSPWLDARAQR